MLLPRNLKLKDTRKQRGIVTEVSSEGQLDIRGSWRSAIEFAIRLDRDLGNTKIGYYYTDVGGDWSVLRDKALLYSTRPSRRL